jgi:BlaI family transcriptional regulator, penicillinase repressor
MTPSRSKIPVPTPAEFRLLDSLWRLKEATVDDLLADSKESTPPNYKTVQTLLRLMENKKLISHRLRGRAFVFQPRVRREQIHRLSIHSFLNRYFGGSRTQLLQNLLQDEGIGAAELEELESLIRSRREVRSTKHPQPNPGDKRGN